VLVEVSAWHGLTPEFMMTIGIIVLGTILYITLTKWQKVYAILPQSFTLNALYDSLMRFGEKTMNRLSRFYMTGILRTFLIYIFVSIVIIMLTTLFIKDAFTIDGGSVAPLNLYGVLTAVILVISVSMIIVAKRRMTALIAL